MVMLKPNAAGQPLQPDGEDQDQHQADPEVRDGRGDHEHRRRDAVQPSAAPPGGQDADAGAQQEGQDRGDADQAERPRDRVQDDPADRLRVEVQRGAELARWPRRRCSAKYCPIRPSLVLTPKAASRAFSACGFTGPRNLPIIASAGLPGISRGRKKLSVSAAHRVSAKKPRRRSTNLMSLLLALIGASFPPAGGPRGGSGVAGPHGDPGRGAPARWASRHGLPRLTWAPGAASSAPQSG